MTTIVWHPLVSSDDRTFMVKGTKLARGIVPGTLSRFVIVAIRCYDANGYSDERYCIEDAETVTLEQVKAGLEPKTVFHGSFDDCIDFCKSICK